MNLQPLYETQKILDQRIIKQHGLEGQDLLPQKILALQVELGECANEWRGFKFWKVDAKPNNHTPVLKDCRFCDGGRIDALTGEECWQCDASGKTVDGYKNMLLEEYVDSLHFILSIGNDIHVENIKPAKLISFSANITSQFNALFHLISHCDTVTLLIDDAPYRVIFNNFLHLGEMLGFTWEQIEQAYYDKNKINHTRQATGY